MTCKARCELVIMHSHIWAMAQCQWATNFTLGPIPKTIKFPYFYWPSFSQDIGPSGYFQSCPIGCRYDKGTQDQVLNMFWGSYNDSTCSIALCRGCGNTGVIEQKLNLVKHFLRVDTNQGLLQGKCQETSRKGTIREWISGIQLKKAVLNERWIF